nr:uncharacterized protein LOC127319587 [Lolium perenne]
MVCVLVVVDFESASGARRVEVLKPALPGYPRRHCRSPTLPQAPPLLPPVKRLSPTTQGCRATRPTSPYAQLRSTPPLALRSTTSSPAPIGRITSAQRRHHPLHQPPPPPLATPRALARQQGCMPTTRSTPAPPRTSPASATTRDRSRAHSIRFRPCSAWSTRRPPNRFTRAQQAATARAPPPFDSQDPRLALAHAEIPEPALPGRSDRHYRPQHHGTAARNIPALPPLYISAHSCCSSVFFPSGSPQQPPPARSFDPQRRTSPARPHLPPIARSHLQLELHPTRARPAAPTAGQSRATLLLLTPSARSPRPCLSRSRLLAHAQLQLASAAARTQPNRPARINHRPAHVPRHLPRPTARKLRSPASLPPCARPRAAPPGGACPPHLGPARLALDALLATEPPLPLDSCSRRRAPTGQAAASGSTRSVPTHAHAPAFDPSQQPPLDAQLLQPTRSAIRSAQFLLNFSSPSTHISNRFPILIFQKKKKSYRYYRS